MKNQLKKSLCILSIAAILTGCAGRTANPVTTWQQQDKTASCSSLVSEMKEIQDNIQRLLPQSDKTPKNVALGVAGLFVFPAWFFMDFSEAEKIEIEAYRNRYNHLVRLYQDKSCSKKDATTQVKPIPEFFKDKSK